ncbi:hypothetical protein L3X38_041555 [Prunus dulcis]|uniref:Uncharacterized protein n=1 Tax=Prunus dulcis TaxID=3755 RepID=A0AAD4YJD6_PRUDU|nr:hypothetical protein L3X38_041555 [Prunus dulcis]
MIIGGEDDKGDYVKLRGDDGDCGPAEGFEGLVEPSFSKKLVSLWYWIRLVLLVMCLVLLAGGFVKWLCKLVGAMDRVMASHINGTLVPLLKEAGALWL